MFLLTALSQNHRIIVTFLCLKFCDLYVTTSEQCCRTALQKLEADDRLKHRQFGSEAETSPEGLTLPVSKPSLKILRKTDHKPAPSKGIYFSYWEL